MGDYSKTGQAAQVGKVPAFFRRLLDQKILFGMSLPFVIWIFIFSYVPIWGWVMAFQNYKPGTEYNYWEKDIRQDEVNPAQARLELESKDYQLPDGRSLSRLLIANTAATANFDTGVVMPVAPAGDNAATADQPAAAPEASPPPAPAEAGAAPAAGPDWSVDGLTRAFNSVLLSDLYKINVSALGIDEENLAKIEKLKSGQSTRPKDKKAVNKAILQKLYPQSISAYQEFLGQEFVGFHWFGELFEDPEFHLALKNTLGMSLLGLLFGFTIPIIFALMLNEMRGSRYRKLVQTVSYLPHFVSWVVVASIVYQLMFPGGILDNIFVAVGLRKPDEISLLANSRWFWGIVTVSDLWKEMGWNSIIFIAAITAIDPELYEAAKVDGAGRFRQMWHITLPGILNLVIVLLVLSIGNLISIGFEKQMLLGNSLVYDSYQVLDLYALKQIRGLRYSFGTAIGMFKSLVSLVLLFSANGLFKKITGESVM